MEKWDSSSKKYQLSFNKDVFQNHAYYTFVYLRYLRISVISIIKRVKLQDTVSCSVPNVSLCLLNPKFKKVLLKETQM